MGANGSQRRKCFECVLRGRGANKDAAVKQFLEERYMPLGIGQPEDVAQAVVFLASPRRSLSRGDLMLSGQAYRAHPIANSIFRRREIEPDRLLDVLSRFLFRSPAEAQPGSFSTGNVAW